MKAADQEAEKTIVDFVDEQKCFLKPLTLDVTSESSCSDAVKTILEEAGQLDVIVHDAGKISACIRVDLVHVHP